VLKLCTHISQYLTHDWDATRILRYRRSTLKGVRYDASLGDYLLQCCDPGNSTCDLGDKLNPKLS